MRIGLATAWLFCSGSTISAVHAQGLNALGPTFIRSFASPWGAAVGVDFILLLIASASWVAWSAKTLPRGLCYGVLAFALGGSFTWLYLLLQTFVFDGDLRAALLGRHAIRFPGSSSEPSLETGRDA